LCLVETMLVNHKKGISVFLSALVIFAIFNLAIVLESEPVYAADGCCITHPNGDYCVDVADVGVCDSFAEYTSCSDLGSYGDDSCELDTCVPAVGTCLSNYPRVQCSAEGGTPYAQPKENVQACKLGCCESNGLCNVVEENICSGEHDSMITNNAVCDNECVDNQVGCCEMAGSCEFNFNSQCVNPIMWHANTECSSVSSCSARLSDSDGHTSLNCGSLEEGDIHKLFWYDSDGNRDDLIDDCGYPDYTCFDSDGDGGSEDAECITTACVPDCPDCDPIEFKNGEQLCLTMYSGSFSSDQKSKFLKEYILECQNGEVEAIEDYAHGEKICISTVKDFGEFDRRNAKFITNGADACFECGEARHLIDVFGYLPGIGRNLVLPLVGEYCSPDDCENIENAEGLKLCDYDHDFAWSPLGSCNPKPEYSPHVADSALEERCNICGAGGDPYTNICTEQECNLIGDCDFIPEGANWESLVNAASGVVGTAVGTAVGMYVICQIAPFCDPNNAGFLSGVGQTIWSMFGNSLFWGVVGSVGGYVERVNAEVEQYDFSAETDDGKADLAKTLAMAKTFNDEGVLEASEVSTGGRFDLGEGIVDIARLLLSSEGAMSSVAIGRFFIQRSLGRDILGAVSGLSGQEAFDAANGVVSDYSTQYGSSYVSNFGADGVQVGPGDWEIVNPNNDYYLDGITDEFTESVSDEVAAESGSFMNTALRTLGIMYTIYQLAEGVNAGSCVPEQSYTNNDHCWQCGGPEGQWECSEDRCNILGADNDHCVYIQNNDEPGNGACVAIDSGDAEEPHVSYIRLDVYDLEGNYVEYLESVESNNMNNLIAPLSGVYDWEDVGSIKISVNTTNDAGESERANCRYGDASGMEYSEMTLFSRSDFPFNNDILFDLGESDKEGGGATYYIKCEDLSENHQGVSEDYYSVQVKFGDRPDYLPPVFLSMSPPNGIYRPEGTNSVNWNIIVGDISNGVAGCKYSQDNSEYATMENSFSGGTPISCPGSESTDCQIFNTNLVFSGAPDLEFDGVETYLYQFACKDNSGNEGLVQGNLQFDSLNASFNIVPTFNVTIDSPADGNLTYDSTPLIQVFAESVIGGTMCSYTLDGQSYEFDEVAGPSFVLEHSEILSGSPFGTLHNLVVSCEDIADNIVSASSAFYVVSDEDVPEPLSIYTGQNYLYLVLNEAANCKYDNEVSNFAFETEGNAMQSSGFDRLVHYAPLGSNVYYIKCQDDFDNIGSFTIYP